MSDYIGQEVAQKLLNTPRINIPTDTGDTSQHILEGQDLQVGGEGMKGFYDKMLKKYAEKWGKKFGAKVGTVIIKSGKNKEISFEKFAAINGHDLVEISNNPPLEARLKKLYKISLEGDKSEQVWNIPITKKMRESVLKKGVPLFSAAGATAVALQDKEQPAI